MKKALGHLKEAWRRMLRRSLFAALAVLLGCFTGCVANPQPVPLPGVNGQALYLSGSVGATATTYLLAGLPGAVSEPEGCQAVVLNVVRGTSQRGSVAADGSFLIEVTRTGTEKLEVWVEQGDRTSPHVAVPSSDVSPPIPPGPLNVQSVSSPVDGLATVVGTAGTSLVVVGNRTVGSSVSTRTGTTGSWSAQIGAAAGHLLVVFQVDETSRAASTPFEVQVPP